MQDVVWMPMIFEAVKPAAKAQMAGPVIANVDDTDYELLFRLPLPAKKGDLRLHIDGMRLGVHTASPQNYVEKFNVNGISCQDVDVLVHDLNPVTGKELREMMFPEIDVSMWESLAMRVWCKVSAPVKLGLTTALLHCYYK